MHKSTCVEAKSVPHPTRTEHGTLALDAQPTCAIEVPNRELVSESLRMQKGSAGLARVPPWTSANLQPPLAPRVQYSALKQVGPAGRTFRGCMQEGLEGRGGRGHVGVGGRGAEVEGMRPTYTRAPPCTSVHGGVDVGV